MLWAAEEAGCEDVPVGADTKGLCVDDGQGQKYQH